MKIVKEEVVIEPGKSMKFFSPSMRKRFFWHYHPEIELVYVEALAGIRHVGKHIGGYVGSDLVLIGPNVPHLNFDYGIETEYKQIVVQLKEQFPAESIALTAEFSHIHRLFERAILGLCFYGKTKEVVIEKLRKIEGMENFSALLEMLQIFEILANSNEVIELNNEDTRVKLFLNDKIRMGAIYDYIHEHYAASPDVNEIAAKVNLSTAAFCRYFKRQTGITFTDFVNQYRISQAKTMLLNDMNVSEVCFLVGFESLSYFNKLFKKIAGETPSAFKKRYRDVISLKDGGE